MKTFAHPGGVDFEAVDLNEIIESTVVMSHHEWKQRAELELDVPDDLPPVRAVPGMINQVVLNLIVNAAHAVAERHGGQDSDGGSGGGGGGSIRVSAEVAGKEIELRVTDNGGGIPESIRGKVYDQFFTTKSVGRGTGQGLAICRNIISRHEGSIGFTTSESGTTFTVRLPRWIQRSDDHDGPAAR
jgi:signal transduction histidine kinase